MYFRCVGVKRRPTAAVVSAGVVDDRTTCLPPAADVAAVSTACPANNRPLQSARRPSIGERRSGPIKAERRSTRLGIVRRLCSPGVGASRGRGYVHRVCGKTTMTPSRQYRDLLPERNGRLEIRYRKAHWEHASQ